tara:strand:- start:1949 stop:3427 length:1479 start_codon:yes stop_codon:yes gene_type:complete
MGFLSSISKVIGYLRDLIIAFFFGTNSTSDLFFLVLRFYGFFQILFGYRHVSPPIVKIVTDLSVNNKEKKGIDLTINFFVFSLLTLLLFLLPTFIFAKNIIIFFLNDLDPNLLSIYLINFRITLICVPFLLATSVLVALLRVRYIFLPAAYLPIIINLSVIIFVTVTSSYAIHFKYLISLSLLISSIFQILTLIYFSNLKIVFLKFPKMSFSANLLSLYKAIFPTIGVGLLLFLVNTYAMISISFTEGNISSFHYANRICYIIIDLFGITLGYVLLSHLARLIGDRNFKKINELTKVSYLFLLLTVLPCSVGLYFYAEIFIEFLFQRGNFNQVSTLNTSLILKGYTVGIPAISFASILAPCYFAEGRFNLLMRLTLIYVLFAILLIELFLLHFEINQVGYSISIASWFYAVLLAFFSKNGKISMFKISMVFLFCKYLFYSIFSISIILLFDFLFIINNFYEFLLFLIIAMFVYFVILYALERKNLIYLRNFM